MFNIEHRLTRTMLCTADGFSTRDITYRWKDGLTDSVSRDPKIQLPTFAVDFIKLTQTTQVLSTGKCIANIVRFQTQKA